MRCVSSVDRVDIIISMFVFFFQAEDGIRDLVRSRGLGDVYKRQMLSNDRILDLSDERGVVCGYVLGQLGADVIHVEPVSYTHLTLPTIYSV